MPATVSSPPPEGAPEVGPRSRPLSLAHRQQIQNPLTHAPSNQKCGIHAAIHKHDLLVIPVSSLVFAFLSAVASDVLGLLFV